MWHGSNASVKDKYDIIILFLVVFLIVFSDMKDLQKKENVLSKHFEKSSWKLFSTLVKRHVMLAF